MTSKSCKQMSKEHENKNNLRNGIQALLITVIYHSARCQYQSNIGKNKEMTIKKRLRHLTDSLIKVNNVVLLIACGIFSEVATLKLEPKTKERDFFLKASLKGFEFSQSCYFPSQSDLWIFCIFVPVRLKQSLLLVLVLCN